MKKKIRIVRQPWTSNITDTIESRIFELFLKQEYPHVELSYIGGDFSLSNQTDEEEIRNVMQLGKITEDPLNFLTLQPYISALLGVKIDNQRSKIRGNFSSEVLFKSETFKREFSSILTCTQDIETQVFLESIGIESHELGCISVLLGLIKEQESSSRDHLDYLFIDLNLDLLQALQNKLAPTYLCLEISTEIPEILGEIEKNFQIDSYISFLRATKSVITSNPVFALAANSLAKEVIFVTNTISTEILVEINKELKVGSVSLDLTRFIHAMPPDRIQEKQDSLKEFIEKSLNTSDNVRIPFEKHSYKDQVIAEIVNSVLSSESIVEAPSIGIMDKHSQLEQLSEQQAILLSSASWKITAPLRYLSRFLEGLRK